MKIMQPLQSKNVGQKNNQQKKHMCKNHATCTAEFFKEK